MGYSAIWLNFTLHVFVRMFMDKSNMLIVRMSTADFPPKVGGHHSVLEDLDRRKKQRTGQFALSVYC
jgi:hypothetical protein